MIPGVAGVAATAGGTPGNYYAISSQVLGSSAASITISSIPATYDDLVLICYYRATTSSSIKLNLNNDTSSIYSMGHTYASGATYSGGSQTAATYAFADAQNISATANVFGQFRLDIFEYKSTSRIKQTLFTAAQDLSAGTGYVSMARHTWNSTAAINRIDLSMTANQFAAGTTVCLYGVDY